MGTCKRCGKRSGWIDAKGYCEKCHDELYVAGMKKLAGDKSKESGLQRTGFGFSWCICRLCGKKVMTSLIEKRTGYCQDCIKVLEAERDLQRRAKAGDEEAIKHIQEREAIAEGLRRAAEEGRLGEVIDILTGAGDEEDKQDEDFEDFDGSDEDDEDEDF